MSNTRPHKFLSGHLTGLIITLICAGAALFLLVNRQYALDQLSVWQYTPSSEIVSFANRSGMSDTGEFYFYASHPSIENASTFNKKCDRKEENTAILGCYDGQNIFIYNVSNEALDGIRDVTAAHEMLHAAYMRMDLSERQKVDALLEAEYTRLSTNQEFADRMAFYARTEPGERDNELHSVIGTEVDGISTALEQHYKKYFSNRSKVVSLHKKYASVFLDLQTRADALSAELTRLGDKIEAESIEYNKDITQFNLDVKQFESRARGGDFSSQAEIDAARDALLARADQLDTKRASINSEVSQYETLRSELMTIASQSEALNRSIDSSLAPAPSL